MSKKRNINNIPKAIVSDKPKPKLPYNGALITDNKLSLSFSCFDRTHKLFNLGGEASDKTVGGQWFIELLDCFRSINSMTVDDLKKSLHDMHPVDWSKSNARAPEDSDQREYMQIRINKSKGRIIGFITQGVFYIVWLDPHHNLTDSEGYGVATYYKPGKSLYEQQLDEINLLKNELSEKEELICLYEELKDNGN